MGEYVEYRGREVKLGTCEDLYYCSYPKYIDALKRGELWSVENNCSPSEYSKINSGFRFRFPFPDEDHLPFGEIGSFGHNRKIPIQVGADLSHTETGDSPSTSMRTLYIVQQKLVNRESDGEPCLTLIMDNEKGQRFRIEDDAFINQLMKHIIRYNIMNEDDPKQRAFLRTIASRILKGYQLKGPRQTPENRLYGSNSNIIRPDNNGQTPKL